MPGPNRPTLYEYRPLVGSFVEQRAGRLVQREDAREALNVLEQEPAAGIFARAHADERVGEDEALRRTILVPLLAATAEACGGFDWDDAAFERAYAGLERSLFGASRAYSALAPLVGLTAGGAVELGRGVAVRPAASGELTAAWPDAARLLPRDFGREVDRTLLLELDCRARFGRLPRPGCPYRVRARGQCPSPRDPRRGRRRAGRLRAARSSPLRRAPAPGNGRPGSAWRGHAPRQFRAPLVGELQHRLAEAPAELLEALDRWELALFHEGSHRSDELREALDALLGCDEGPWAAAMRAAVLLGETAREREQLLVALRALLDGDGPGARAEDAVRRALVETLVEGSRERLVAVLDEALLGLRPRPQVTTGRARPAAG